MWIWHSYLHRSAKFYLAVLAFEILHGVKHNSWRAQKLFIIICYVNLTRGTKYKKAVKQQNSVISVQSDEWQGQMAAVWQMLR